MSSKRLVLVTGGCGFIGRNLIPLLLKNSYAVRVLDNLSVGAKDAISAYPVELIEGDIRDPLTVEQSMQDVYAVVHLAAHTSVIDSQAIPRLDHDINVCGTLNLLISARDQNVERSSSRHLVHRSAKLCHQSMKPSQRVPCLLTVPASLQVKVIAVPLQVLMD